MKALILDTQNPETPTRWIGGLTAWALLEGNYACDCNRAPLGELPGNGPHYCHGAERWIVVAVEAETEEDEDAVGFELRAFNSDYPGELLDRFLPAAQPKPKAPRTSRGLIVAVDFDGTCVTHEYPAIGRDIGAVPVLQRLAREGARIILWTMRSGATRKAAMAWFRDNDIPLFGVNRNPEQASWSMSPKAYANLYIDDAALGCPLTGCGDGERPHVDWKAVEQMLWPTFASEEDNPT